MLETPVPAPAKSREILFCCNAERFLRHSLTSVWPATEISSNALLVTPNTRSGWAKSMRARRSSSPAPIVGGEFRWSMMDRTPWLSHPVPRTCSRSNGKVPAERSEGLEVCGDYEETSLARCITSRRASFRPICRSSSPAPTVAPRWSTKTTWHGRLRSTSRQSESTCPGLGFQAGAACPATSDPLSFRVTRQQAYSGCIERSHGSGRWISNGC